MEESFQSNPSSGMSEEIQAALDAGINRDINMIRAMFQMELNNLSIAYENISVLLGVLNPEKRVEFETSTMFSIQDARHLVSVVLGDEREVSLDPSEKT